MSAAWQEAFVAQLLASSTPTQRGMAVYHNNLRVNFRKALELGFPTLRQLMGEQYFAKLAESYRAVHPSRSGDLHELGAHFAAFLAKRYRDSSKAYWADLAELEWTWQRCLVAADETPLGPAAFAAIERDRWPLLRLRLQPSLCFVSSPYPIVTIWSHHREFADNLAAMPQISLADGAESAWIAGTPHGPRLEGCTPGERRWLCAIQDGASLADSLDAADEHFLFADYLQRIMQAGLIVELYDP
jgi:hypothetical protein